MADLRVEFAGLKLKNPIVAGGGPLAGTVDHIKKCVDAGFGAIVTKTVAYLKYIQRWPRPRYLLVDYKKKANDPYYVPDDYTWLHREHNSVYPPESFAKIIKEAAPYAKEHDCAIIGSINGRGLDEWVKMAKMYEEAGCSALEINFCCPFPPVELVEKPEDAFMGIAFTLEPEKGVKIIETLKNTVQIPLFAKLNPDGQDFEGMAEMFKDAGVDGLTMFANNRLMRVDIETGEPTNWGPCAGTGPAFKGHSIACIARVARTAGLPLMGGRGATTWQDGIEFMMAGANAVQYCSPIMLRGLSYVKELIRGMEGYMERRRYNNPSEFVGKALKTVYSTKEIIAKTKALYSTVDLKKCVGCGRCAEVCFYDVIEMHRKPKFYADRCVGCTLCKQVCPVDAIEMKERDNDLDHFKAYISAHPEWAAEDIKKGQF